MESQRRPPGRNGRAGAKARSRRREELCVHSRDGHRSGYPRDLETGETLIGEATTSWSFVGAGLRLSAELLGPEYSLTWNTLESGLRLFFSRQVLGEAGEDLVEKQNAEIGLMPVVADEAAAYGYVAEDRHFTRAFALGEPPMLTFDDGVEVVRILMAAYMSAERGRTVGFPPRGLDSFIPQVARR